jgi:hypothetical protein
LHDAGDARDSGRLSSGRWSSDAPRTPLPLSGHVMEQQVNLYQPILGAEKRLFSARALASCLVTLIGCLGALTAFEASRTTRIEKSVMQLEERETSNIEVAARAGAVFRPTLTVAQLEAQAQHLSADIATRERALDIMRRGAVSVSTGFAARLEALANQQVDGIWLSNILLSSDDGRLAMQGRTTNPNLLPVYLNSLSREHAMDGVRFDSLAMRRALPTEIPAQVVFAIGSPGLKFTAIEHGK